MKKKKNVFPLAFVRKNSTIKTYRLQQKCNGKFVINRATRVIPGYSLRTRVIYTVIIFFLAQPHHFYTLICFYYYFFAFSYLYIICNMKIMFPYTQETDAYLSVEANESGRKAVRDKRTIGFLRQMFPNLSQVNFKIDLAFIHSIVEETLACAHC